MLGRYDRSCPITDTAAVFWRRCVWTAYVLSQVPHLYFDGWTLWQLMSYHRHRSCVLTAVCLDSSCPITGTTAVFWRRCVWTAYVLSQVPQLCFDGDVFGQLMSYHRYRSFVLTAVCLDRVCPITGTAAVFWRLHIWSAHVLSQVPQLYFDGCTFCQLLSLYLGHDMWCLIVSLFSSCSSIMGSAVLKNTLIHWFKRTSCIYVTYFDQCMHLNCACFHCQTCSVIVDIIQTWRTHVDACINIITTL